MFLEIGVFCEPKHGNVANKYKQHLLGDKGRPAREADILTVNHEPRRLTTLWPSTVCYRDILRLTYVLSFDD
jgi:hypothetical protein